MKILNQANINKRNESETIINISEILIDDLKENRYYLNKAFNYTINYLLDNTNIKFNEIRSIVKYYNKGQYFVVMSLLQDLIDERKAYIKGFYL